VSPQRDSSPAPRGRRQSKTAPIAQHGAKTDPTWAWAPYQPDANRPWDLRQAGHLLRRAGFGAGWDALQEALRDGPQRAVDRLLSPAADVAAFNRTYDDLESAVDAGSESTAAIGQWWLRRMMDTPHPLLEKMTLFWHNHFATSVARGSHALSMHRHLKSLRGQALGRFSDMFHEVICDGTMLVVLDAAANRKARPSESFARAFLELLTVGPGNFTEEDVRGVARAFTGWFVIRNQVRYLEREHDDGPKKILGREGPWKHDDAVKIALAQPGTARQVVRKLYQWLISETQAPAHELIAPLAESFGKDYEIGKLVGTMLRSNLFFSAAAYRQRVKSPVEYGIGIVRGMEALVNPEPLAAELAQMGQTLCHPPTVRGWPGGTAWITDATLLRRSNLALAMFAASGPFDGKLDPWAIARKHGHSTPEGAAGFLIELYMQGDLDPAVRAELLKGIAEVDPKRVDRAQAMRQLARTGVTLPEFQLS